MLVSKLTLFGLIKISFLAVIFLLPLSVSAQNEIGRARISLQGIQEFGFTVNVEGTQTVTDHDSLSPGVIRELAIQHLRNADLRFVSSQEVESSADIPFLYMHINTMQLDNGLVPFSIELQLFQPVKLILNRDLQTSASTWDSGTVGIVSLDQIPVIKEAASNMISGFIDDYQIANNHN